MQLKDLRLLKAEFAMNLSYISKDGDEIETKMSMETYEDGDQNKMVALMNIKTTGENKPYSFNIQYGVKFELAEGEKDHLERICKVNIPGIVYPYLCEFVGDLTRRAGFPPLLLQPVNFLRVTEPGAIETS